MDFLEALEQRYTCKKYKPEAKIGDDLIAKLKRILQLSPSSINSQPWQFTFIDNPQLKGELSKVSFHNTDKVKDCSHLVVFSVVSDIEVFRLHLNNLSTRVQKYFSEHIETQEEDKIRSWFSHQLYISLGIFLSACASYGIDSTPMEGIEKKAYKHILRLKDYDPMFAVAIGERHPDDPNQLLQTAKSRRALEDVINEVDFLASLN